MCSAPAFLAAAQIASTVSGVVTQRQNAKALEAFQEQRHSTNRAIAERAAGTQVVALQARQVQESEAAAREIELNARRAIQARGRATTAAGEAGAFGNSFNALINNFTLQESEYRNAVLRTNEQRREQLVFDLEAVRSGLHGRILSTLPQPVARPDYLGALFSIGGSIAEAAVLSQQLNST